MALRGRSLVEPLKPVWRKFAQAEREAFAAKIGAGGGGSLVRAVRRAKISIRRWGYVIHYATITVKRRKGPVVKHGQTLTWYVRGTKKRYRKTWRGRSLKKAATTGAIPAHPAASSTDVDALAAEVARVAAATIAAWDKEVR